MGYRRASVANVTLATAREAVGRGGKVGARLSRLPPELLRQKIDQHPDPQGHVLTRGVQQ